MFAYPNAHRPASRRLSVPYMAGIYGHLKKHMSVNTLA